MHINSDCGEISLIIGNNWGDIETGLESWIENGPGPKQRTQPHKVICKDTDSELPISIIPLQYRNNALSHFLIAFNVLEFPWDDASIEAEYFVHTLPIDNINIPSIETKIELQADNSRLLTIAKTLKLQIPSIWELIGGMIFDTPSILISNRKLSDTNLSFSDMEFRPNDFILACTGFVTGFDDFRLMEKYVPDVAFSSNWQRQDLSLTSYPAQYIMITSDKFNIAIVTVLIKIVSLRVGAIWFQVHCVTHKDSGERMLKVIKDLAVEI